ncbi:Protein TolB [Planctomycetes bacterium CA13]|uniref:Protein TolB n=1 Tax=Novipirellula herctigrandis TaxID=2527986 RepID=A0A5C5Z1X4_9BACT|nr:Protein TolB [Planctomycetes bacterium CA13]
MKCLFTNLVIVAAVFASGSIADEPVPPTYRGSYFVNGEIHVNTYGLPEGKPLTTGHHDFKPSWSKTDDMLVFFRRLKNDPVVTNWITAICIINVDGTGFHQLTDGTHTEFNQTWTRDATNTPIWNRKNPETKSFHVMQSKVGGLPGEEVSLTDKHYHTWAYTCLTDGRILVQSAHPTLGWGYFLMTPSADHQPRYERIDCELATKGILDRVSISPSEKQVCFEYQTGFKHKNTGRTLYIADFDSDKRTIANAKAFANEAGNPGWFAYPRWTKDEKAIVYHANETGKGKLFLYTLKDGSTKQVSTNNNADYRYPHTEATPK